MERIGTGTAVATVAATSIAAGLVSYLVVRATAKRACRRVVASKLEAVPLVTDEWRAAQAEEICK